MPLASRRRSARTKSVISGPADTLFVGVDEAGYGPNIGPLVVSSTAFYGPSALDAMDWWDVLDPTIGRAKRSQGRIVIDDSKAVLSSPSGRTALDRTVSSLLRLVSWTGGDLKNLVEFLSPSDAEHLCSEHWFTSEENCCSSDETAEPIDHECLLDCFGQCSLTFETPIVRLLFPGQFNERLNHVPTKADVECQLILDLLSMRLASLSDDCQHVVITVDRLGGRRYYRTMVETLAGDAFVFTVGEEADLSVYRFESEGRDVEIRFRVKGDSHSLPVAAASMFAKHMRERCMDGFNDYWCTRIPGLARTAGYPGDARRFLEAVEEQLMELDIPMSAFWRIR